MKWFTSSTALLTLALSATHLGAQDLRTIEAKVASMEDRIAALEAKLQVGQPIMERDLSLSPTQPQPMPGPMVETPSQETYVIRDGDSMGGIARKYNIPHQALLDANKMVKGQPIYIGETLIIPSPPTTTTTTVAQPAQASDLQHTVATGDTLTNIARRYGTTVQELKIVNNLKTDVISLGAKLKIPGAPTMTAAAQAQAATDADAPGSDLNFQYDNPLLKSDETYGYYTVQKGDNLYALARDFFTTMKELQRLNKLGNSAVIHPGDELVVPTSKYNTYHQNIASN